jgi:hypothetical protein
MQTGTQREQHVKMKAETGVMHLHAKKYQLASKSPEVRRQTWNRFSLNVLGRNQFCHHLDARLLAFRKAWQYIFVL